MRRAYISLLTNEHYLPGLLGLVYSIRATRSKYDVQVLVTASVHAEIKNILESHNIPWIEIAEIDNPTDVAKNHRWNSTYSKLHVFGLTSYDKVVFVDADILVLENIDCLFECEHMSGVSSGSMLPEYADWTSLNSGLFVVTPDALLLSGMLAKIGRIENLCSGGTANTPRAGSDQDFINAYYPDWRLCDNLHLDHKYNILHYHLDKYSRMFGYGLESAAKRIAVVHFASYLKPWNLPVESLHRLGSGGELSLEEQALRLWGEWYALIRKNTGFDIPAVPYLK